MVDLSVVACVTANGDFIGIQFQTRDGLGQHVSAANASKGKETSKVLPKVADTLNFR